MTTTAPLAPGSIIGILGGGQLGRMLATAGAELGFDVHVFDPAISAPAARVAARGYAAPWDDLGAVASFAARCDAVTYEFENVPVNAVKAAATEAPVRPGIRSLSLTQDRIEEKTFIRAAGAGTADFAAVDTLDDLRTAIKEVGTPAILKTRRFGYDGKGQAVIRTADDADAAWEAVGGAPSILESMVEFRRELSVVAARALDGSMAIYPLGENDHEGGILRVTQAPAAVGAATQAEAERIARILGDGMEHVGVFAVELFDLGGGQLLVNEIAPRVHNTGHWTMDACACGQFEQHIRAVAGWPLVSTTPHSSAIMTNLIGHDVDDWANIASMDDARLHLYGKHETREGRKMGHVTVLGAPVKPVA
tara:strand:- start:23816 stop:24910 length:1095 start_codon:yes stop_codon:yes gene_type:complete